MLRKRDEFEWDELATYNSEVARGIVHTPEWKEKMAREQRRFRDWQQEWYDKRGIPVKILGSSPDGGEEKVVTRETG